MSWTRKLSFLINCVALLGLLSATSVSAAPEVPVETAARHCIGVATANSAVQRADESTSVEEDAGLGPKVFLPLIAGSSTDEAHTTANCFSTFSEAVRAATSGAVNLPADATPDTINAASLQTPSVTTVIGVMYSNSSYGGSTFTWYVNNSYGCTGGYSYSNATPPSGWNDVVSSAIAYGGCGRWYHYENTYYGGAALVVATSRSSFGAMNDRASSWRWWASGYHY